MDERPVNPEAGNDRPPREPADGRWTEVDRLEALARYAILDTPREQEFDDVARLAADIFEAPIAVVNLIAAGRQWFKAEVGIGVDELPLDVSICAHAILQPDVFVVPDTTADARFACNPLVTGDPGLRFYAGALLATPEGLPLGTVCVLDTKPRPEGITERQHMTLEVLARQVMNQLELRLAVADRDRRAERLEREIAGHRETDKVLRETERRLNAVLNNTRMAVFLMDHRQHCIFANTAAEKLTGYPFEQMQGRPLHDVVHHKKPDGSHYPLEECPIDRAFPERAHMSGEELFVAPDGSFYPVAFTASPVLDDGGNPIGTVIEVRNITEEKSARERLIQLAAVAEQSRDFIGIADLDGRPIFVNEAGCAMMGLASLEAAGKRHLLDYLAPSYRKTITEIALPSAEEAGYWEAEVEFRRFDDQRDFPVLYNLFPVRNDEGELTHYATVTRDLTEKKAAAAAVRDAEERLRLATDAADVGTWDHEPARDAVNWDARCKALFGMPVDTAVDTRLWLSHVHPEDRADVEAAYSRAIDPSGDGTFDVEHRTLGMTDGVVRWVSAKGGSLFEAGRVVRFIGTIIDITSRKEIQAALAASESALRQESRALDQLARTLEEKVAERTAALEAEMANRTKAEEALRQSQKMEAVGQLTGGIAHDFNNMLTGVIGALDIIKRRLARGRTDDLDRFMDAATVSAQRAAALTARLLAFSRRQSLDARPVDINALTLSLEDLLHRTTGENVNLRIVTCSDAAWAVVDANQLENAILNLVINARDAMPDGGKLTIETSVTELDQAYVAGAPNGKPGRYVRVAVSDTGVGMSADLLEKVFEPFFTTKPVGQGTGLGLSMVYGFAHQSAGLVRIHSQPGEGSSVKLYLPVSETERNTADATLSPVAREGSGQTVLIVEDDPSVRLLVQEVLEELHYNAVEAGDADAALRILATDRPIDLMISDVGLPGMNGRQLAEIARAQRPDLPILFITGYAENAAIRAGFLGTNMAMITKPFALDTLAEKIDEMVSGS